VETQHRQSGWSSGASKALRRHLVATALAPQGTDVESWRQHLRRKGEPGSDSFNTGVAESTIGKMQYSRFEQFMRAVDILASSGIPVDLLLDDFEAYYPQWTLDALERHFFSEVTSSAGVDQSARGTFGPSHLPEKLNRTNFIVCEVIQIELDAAQEQFTTRNCCSRGSRMAD
jgi:hypothetical protein